jgi:hypothetical protein
MEPDRDRFIAMQDRRKDILEKIIKEINPKAYEVTLIEMSVELSDIYSAIFDVWYEGFARSGKPLKKAEAKVMNESGLKSI